MLLLQFLLLLMFNFSVPHDDLVAQPVQRADLLAERRLRDSVVRRFKHAGLGHPGSLESGGHELSS